MMNLGGYGLLILSYYGLYGLLSDFLLITSQSASHGHLCDGSAFLLYDQQTDLWSRLVQR